ncbi:MFS transporter [Streptomyces sp. TRM66268-LWL]|uniref:MFS transporter n=2 Tax=Streptomyces polyasparticus TaxID=2767826 RepID=A0ABR7S845_9ACTN|nr:MFS transporter [Streptomyces polyasparticus]
MRPPAAAVRPGLRLALLGLAGLITALDFTIVYVALPEIAAEVGFSPHGLQWVVSAYAVVYGGFLLLGGRAADLVGRRRVFVTGLLLYGAGSLLGGLAPSPELLIAARVVQGLGGAALFPATLSLVTSLFAEGPARNRALTVWAVSGAAGLSLGALAGGVLTGAFGWEAVFYVNVPLVALCAAGAFRLLPGGAGDGERGGRLGGERATFDVPGAVLSTAGITLLVFAVAQGPEWGWTSPGVLGAAGAAALLLAAFAAVEARTAAPLMPLRLFRHRSLGPAMLAILAFGATLQAVPYFLTLFYQLVLGYSALATGLAFLTPTLSITVGNLAGERLVARIGTRSALVAGFALGGAGAALTALATGPDGSFAGGLAGVAVYGLGCGITFNTMWIAAASGIAPHEQGTASGMASTVLQAATGGGLAVLVAVAGRSTAGRTGEALRVATADGLRAVFWWIAAGAVLGAVASLTVPKPAKSP